MGAPPTPLAHHHYMVDARGGPISSDDRRLGVDGRLPTIVGRLSLRYDDLADDVLGPVVHVPRHGVFTLRDQRGTTSAVSPTILDRGGEGAFRRVRSTRMLPFRRCSPVVRDVVARRRPRARMAVRPRRFTADHRCTVARSSARGQCRCGREVRSLADVHRRRRPCSTKPRHWQLLPVTHCQAVSPSPRVLRHGPGSFRSIHTRRPVPWPVEACRRAGTVHVGAPAEIAAAEATVATEAAEKPFVLAPNRRLRWHAFARGTPTLWVYAHVPNDPPRRDRRRGAADRTIRPRLSRRRALPAVIKAAEFEATTPTTSAVTSRAAPTR